MTNVPILLITFNRPKHVSKVLEEIRKAKPQDLYLFRDGPRPGNVADEQKCERVCEVLDEFIDWPCNLHKFISKGNLGCGNGPKLALDWFFSNVEMGIVMEDDCLPHPDFFAYCEELLEKYKDVPQVQFINSTLYDKRWQCEKSYGFSRYMVTGAWAAWRRAWQGFDLDLKNINANKFRRHCIKLLYERAEANWWYFKLIEIQHDKSKKSYWDYQMQILLFLHNAVTIHPAKNLISNIGFDAEGTHTLSNNDGRGGQMSYPIMPLHHPDAIHLDKAKDSYCFAKTRSKGTVKDFVEYVYKSMLWSDGLMHEMLMVYKRLKGK